MVQIHKLAKRYSVLMSDVSNLPRFCDSSQYCCWDSETK